MGVAEAPGNGGATRRVVIEIERAPGDAVRIEVSDGEDAIGLGLAALLGASSDRTRNAPSLAIRTGDPRSDELLDTLAPLLAELLAGLTERQRTVARLLLVDRLRQAEIAQRLGIRRATVSVMAARLRSVDRLVRALRAVLAGSTAPTHP